MIKNTIVLSHQTKQVVGTVKLTGSKSESNRALVIRALSKGSVLIENLSEAADTVTMSKSLRLAAGDKSAPVKIDIGPAGTAMRFLCSYLNLVDGKFLLTGSKRMLERPIRLLVDALRTIGADIHYEGQEGFPPLLINGTIKQQANKISIPGNVSSQYISSLLLISPSLKEGLTLTIEGELTSRPYVSMTLNMLKETGISYNWSGNTIHIPPQEHVRSTLYIEPDWSAASYWYAIVALSEEGQVRLPGLRRNSLQGDIAIAEIMTHFGVHTTFETGGIFLQKNKVTSETTFFDLKECPDLAQTIIVVAAAMRKNVSFTGLETLKIKETDRIAALQNEMEKFGCKLTEDQGVYHLDTSTFYTPDVLTIDTYEDHRMAMAFAPLALIFPKVHIVDPNVVEKSYPDFWKNLQEQGFATQS